MSSVKSHQNFTNSQWKISASKKKLQEKKTDIREILNYSVIYSPEKFLHIISNIYGFEYL